MKVIDFEAHFRAKEYGEFLNKRKMTSQLAPLNEALNEYGEGRLKKMDEDGIDMEVLLHCSPHPQHLDAEEGTDWSRKINDELSAMVKKYPDRFIGLAVLAPQSPLEAADELDRAVVKLGLKGLALHSHVRNEYLDDRKYWVIFERAEKLDVPVYIHPATPSTSILKPYADYGFALFGPSLGYAADASLHVMRLIYSGLFDKYPRLKIVLGHMGEGLPYWGPRLDYPWLKGYMEKDRPAIMRKPTDYLKTNFMITTSGTFFYPALLCSMLALGTDNIAFAVDYPYEQNEEALRFINNVPISDSDKEKICHLNAERLFKL